MRIVVYHCQYDDDTGCCGHVVEVVDGSVRVDGREMPTQKFFFDHARSESDADTRSFAEELVTDMYGAEHVSDIDWESCVIKDD